MSRTNPELSVVIPVYDEEAILETATRALVAKLRRAGWAFELWLAENGSRDDTAQIASDLAREIDVVHTLHVSEANYGRALRAGIERARGTYVVCDEIDLGDVGFYARALGLLREGADLVIGSKRHPESVDARPWLRRRGTQVMSAMLRLTLGFTGTDTHGLKAFRRDRLLPVVSRCAVEHDLFASELVVRAERSGLDVREIPLRLREIRPPSVGLTRRVPRVLSNLAKLVYAIRIRNRNQT